MMNRTLCDVLEAMRKCQETSNYSYLSGLIEEAQNMGNRMESALYDKGDLNRAREDYKKEKKKRDELKEEIKVLEQKKDSLSKSEKKRLKIQYAAKKKEQGEEVFI